MWLDIRYYNNNTRRMTVTGHQDGLLKVSIVNVETLGTSMCTATWAIFVLYEKNIPSVRNGLWYKH